MSHIYVGNMVNPVAGGDLQCLENHMIIVDADGLITYFGPIDATLLQSDPSAEITELDSNAFLIPPFVDTHFHAPQYYNVGIGYDLPLMSWLDKYTYPAESKVDQDPKGFGKAIYTRLVQRLLEEGIGAILFFGTQSVEANLVLAQCCLDKGIRSLVGKVSQDRNSPPNYIEATDKSLEANEAFVQRMFALVEGKKEHQRLVEPVLTPRFLPTCSTELIAGIASIAQKYNVFVQTHLCESAGEVAFAKSLTNGKDELEFYDELGFLSDKCLMAHCTHIQPHELQKMADMGVSIAHCPLSNVYFSERAFPLREAMQLDVKVGLGLDVSGGHAMSANMGARMAVVVSRSRQGKLDDGQQDPYCVMAGDGDKGSSKAITWKEALYLSTLGGARALNLDRMMGSFAVGKSFDAQHILLSGSDASRIDLFSEYRDSRMTLEEKVERWFCLGEKADRKAMFIAGKKVYTLAS